MANPWTEAEQIELARRHAEGQSLTRIAREMKRSKQTIGSRAKRANLSFAAPAPEAAIEKFIFDRKAARARIIEKLYARADFNMDRLNEKEFETLIKSGPGEETAGVLEFVPAIDEKNLIAAVGIILTSAAKLETIDQDGGLTEARGLLGKFFAAIDMVAEPEPGVEA